MIRPQHLDLHGKFGTGVCREEEKRPEDLAVPDVPHRLLVLLGRYTSLLVERMKERERRVRRFSVRHAGQFDNVLGERPLRQKKPCCTTLYFHPKKIRACPEVRSGEQTSQTLLHILDSGAIAKDQNPL